MLHRNGTRLEVGTSDDVAELELVEARRLAEIQRRHQRVAVSVGGPRTAGSAGGSTVLSYGSVPTHTRTPGRAGGPSGSSVGEFGSGGGGGAGGLSWDGQPRSTVHTTTATASPSEPMRATTSSDLRASPSSVRGSWRSPAATTNPSPSAVRPSYPSASPVTTATTAMPPGGPMRYAGGHFPDISSVLASEGGGLGGGVDDVVVMANRPQGRLVYPASATTATTTSMAASGGVRDPMLAGGFAAPYGASGSASAASSETSYTPHLTRARTATLVPQPHTIAYGTSPMEGRASVGGARTPRDRHQWPPPPSAFMHNTSLDADRAVINEELSREDSDELEPSPTRRSGLLPPQ